MYSSFYGVCIGIDKYNTLKEVRGGENAAKNFASLLGNLGFNVTELYGSQAITMNIGKSLAEVRQKLEKLGNSNSLLVVYFSGHVYAKDDSIQLCPYNFDEYNVVETGQNLLNLKNRIMTTFPCKHVLFIFDCKFQTNIFDE